MDFDKYKERLVQRLEDLDLAFRGTRFTNPDHVTRIKQAITSIYYALPITKPEVKKQP